jgi:hypothetical protein
MCCYSVFKDRAQAFLTTENPAVLVPRRAGYSNTTEMFGQCFSLLFFVFDSAQNRNGQFMSATRFVCLKDRGKLLYCRGAVKGKNQFLKNCMAFVYFKLLCREQIAYLYKMQL